MADLFLHRTALVTGASSGLGREFARELARRGTSLVLTARSKEALEELAQEIEDASDVSVEVVPANLATEAGVTELLTALDARNTPIDHLINNAGYGTTGPFAQADPTAEVEMIRLHLEALIRLTRHLLPGMLERGHGGVLNVASVLGLMPAPFMATYGATKTFMIAFTRALAEELKASPLRVSVLCPGPVPTGFQKRARIAYGGGERLLALSAEKTVRRALDAYENGRLRVAPGFLNSVVSLAAECVPWALSGRIYALVMRLLGRVPHQSQTV